MIIFCSFKYLQKILSELFLHSFATKNLILVAFVIIIPNVWFFGLLTHPFLIFEPLAQNCRGSKDRKVPLILSWVKWSHCFHQTPTLQVLLGPTFHLSVKKALGAFWSQKINFLKSEITLSFRCFIGTY